MNWTVREKTPTKNLSPQEIINLIIKIRGINSKQINDFLNPQLEMQDLKQLFNPQQVETAVNLIEKTIEKRQPIFIHGDYDVDGICATALLWETIYRQRKYPLVRPFIPHRQKHGYGITETSLHDLLQESQKLSEQPPLLITVDCGITAKKLLESFPGPVILTDHHLSPEKTPQTKAVIHSTEVCGATIAWYLSQEINPDNNLEYGLDLAGLATISDLIPLTGINRSIVHYGLKILRETKRPGLKNLAKIAGVDLQTISADKVSWTLTPRLNAPGRLGDATDSLRLLVAEQTSFAQKTAEKIDQQNKLRQNLSQKGFQGATTALTENPSPVIVLAAPWHEGIIGLIASRISEKTRQPTLIISTTQNPAKGSARCPEGMNLMQILQPVIPLLDNFGGHSQAGGFSLSKEKIDDFITATRKIKIPELAQIQKIEADLILDLDQISPDLYQKIEQLEPFGKNNPQPLFFTQATVYQSYCVGSNNQHLKIKLTSPDNNQSPIIDAIGFHLGHVSPQLSTGSIVDLIYTIQKNSFRGEEKIQINIHKIRPIPQKTI